MLTGLNNITKTVAFNNATWQMQPAPGAIRLMTWNVSRFSSPDKIMGANVDLENKILAVIQKYHPDILCMQEYRDMQFTGVQRSVKKKLESLGFVYSAVSNDTVANKDYGVVIVGTAIFSRIAIKDSGRISLQQKKNESMAFADFSFNNNPFRVYTCHLLSFSLYREDILEGVREKNIDKVAYRHKSKTEYRMRKIGLEHQKEAAIIRANIAKSPYPVIFCGDLNEVPVSYIYNTVKGDLQDAFIKKGSGLGRTFFKLSPTLRIDVCLPSKQFDILQYTCPQVMLSDHFPVISDFTWAK